MSDGKPHPLDLRLEAESRYVYGDMSIRLLSQDLGIPNGTLERWSSKGGWDAKRQQARESLSKARVNLCDLYNEMIQKARETRNPKDVRAALEIGRVIEKYQRGEIDPAGSGISPTTTTR